MGRTLRMTIECTGYERPRRLASRTRLSNMDIEGNLSFEPVAGGTRMRWLWELMPRGALRLMVRFRPHGPAPGADHLDQPQARLGSAGR